MSIAENLEKVEEGIAAACEKAVRHRDEVRLVAVSKTKPVELIEEAVISGQVLFGENKVQELISKQPQFPGHVQWHLIGHLQKNKVRKVLPCIDMLETLDSVSLAERVDRIADELNLTVSGLLQVNISDDDAKFGFSEVELEETMPKILGLEHIRIRGLMTIPALDPDPEKTRPHFANLRTLRDYLEDRWEIPLPELSMGMSHDYSVAIEEGATLVRVGTAIFGKRE